MVCLESRPKVMFFDSRPHGRHRDEPSRWAESVFWLAKVRTSDGVSRIETKGGLFDAPLPGQLCLGPSKDAAFRDATGATLLSSYQ